MNTLTVWVGTGLLIQGQPCRLPPLTGSPIPGQGRAYWCLERALPSPNVSFAFLVDDSGSMGGHRSAIGRIARWIELAQSRLAASGTHWTQQRACYFSSARPLSQCRRDRLDPSEFSGRGQTTLAEALEYSARFDLAVIVTDGVGTVSTGPACAQGMDAACLGMAMANLLEPRAGEPESLVPGLWLVPLVSWYEGVFFTEEEYSLQRFDAERLRRSVAADTGLAAVASAPRVDASGSLAYEYRGPRVFLLVVTARRLELGRAFLGALVGATTGAGVAAVTSLRMQWQTLGALPVIEAFPGIVPRITGFGSARLDPRACRTLDAKLTRNSEIHIDCPNPVDEGITYLIAQPTRQSPNCVEILNLPSTVPRVFSSDTNRAPVRGFAWRGEVGLDGRPLELALHLRCQRGWSLPCPAGGITVSWVVQFDYAATVWRLRRLPSSPAEGLVADLSATSVVHSPHRLLQLRETLQVMYGRLATRRASTEQEILRIRFCKP